MRSPGSTSSTWSTVESIDSDAVRRAIELSATKYCSVGATLSSGLTEVHHRFVVRCGDGEERAEEVIVTGPHQSAEPAARPAALSTTVDM